MKNAQGTKKRVKKKTPVKANPQDKVNTSARILIYVVIVAMVLSGVSFVMNFGSNDDQSSVSLPYVETYSVHQILNSSIVLSVDSVQPEIIASIKSGMRYGIIESVQNISLGSLEDVSVEVGNPSFTSEGVLGTYVFVKFRFDSLDENTSYRVQRALDSLIGRGNYDIFGLCGADLPFNLSGPGTGRTQILCPVDAKEEELFRVILLTKETEGYFDGSVAFVAKKVGLGPVVDATVVGLDSLIAEGSFDEGFDPSDLDELDRISFSFDYPKLTLDRLLSPEIESKLDSLDGIEISVEGNQTFVVCNSSKVDAMIILENANLTYTSEDGYVFIEVPAEFDPVELDTVLASSGVSEIEYMKRGTVNTFGEVLIDGKLVEITSNQNLDTLLKADADTGDLIRIRLSTFNFDDRLLVYGAEQTS